MRQVEENYALRKFVSDRQGDAGEDTKRIDARGNTGEQTNINVEGDFIVNPVGSSKREELLERLAELQDQEIKRLEREMKAVGVSDKDQNYELKGYTLRQLFGDSSSVYVIPSWNRSPTAWSEDSIRFFFRELYDESRYIWRGRADPNALLVQERENEYGRLELEVIDGSQRLLFWAIVISALRDYLEQIGLKRLASHIHMQYITNLFDGHRVRWSNPYFSTFVRSFPSIPFDRPTNPEEERIQVAYRTIMEEIVDRNNSEKTEYDQEDWGDVDYITELYIYPIMNNKVIGLMTMTAVSPEDTMKLFTQISKTGQVLSDDDLRRVRERAGAGGND